jgi:alkylhydroperoxidase/carboxymuconolactone decarboxylase family protein YurZ
LLSLSAREGYDHQVVAGPGEEETDMAVGNAPVLETVMEMTAVSLERTALEPSTLLMVRLAALAAVDAPTASYLMHIGPAADSGLTLDQVQDVLVGIAPVIGAPRTVSAAAKIVEALGFAIALEEADAESMGTSY